MQKKNSKTVLWAPFFPLWDEQQKHVELRRVTVSQNILTYQVCFVIKFFSARADHKAHCLLTVRNQNVPTMRPFVPESSHGRIPLPASHLDPEKAALICPRLFTPSFVLLFTNVARQVCRWQPWSKQSAFWMWSGSTHHFSVWTVLPSNATPAESRNLLTPPKKFEVDVHHGSSSSTLQ